MFEINQHLVSPILLPCGCERNGIVSRNLVFLDENDPTIAGRCKALHSPEKGADPPSGRTSQAPYSAVACFLTEEITDHALKFQGIYLNVDSENGKVSIRIYILIYQWVRKERSLSNLEACVGRQEEKAGRNRILLEWSVAQQRGNERCESRSFNCKSGLIRFCAVFLHTALDFCFLSSIVEHNLIHRSIFVCSILLGTYWTGREL